MKSIVAAALALASLATAVGCAAPMDEQQPTEVDVYTDIDFRSTEAPTDILEAQRMNCSRGVCTNRATFGGTNLFPMSSMSTYVDGARIRNEGSGPVIVKWARARGLTPEYMWISPGEEITLQKDANWQLTRETDAPLESARIRLLTDRLRP